MMKRTYKTIDELLLMNDSPLPLSVIPNYMGINLSVVQGISWLKLPDGNIIDLTIHFIREGEILK